jgi:hypothetical protein
VGILADRLDGMQVRVAVPGGHVRAVLSGRTSVTLTFADGYYQRSTDDELQHDLEALARLLWAARTREYHRALEEAFSHPTLSKPAVGARDVAFHEARDRLVATGASDDGRIRIAVRGMRHWTVQVASGTTQALSEDAFVAGVRTAAGRLIRHQLDQMALLKDRVYA